MHNARSGSPRHAVDASGTTVANRSVGRTRVTVGLVLFAVTTLNYADRGALSITATSIQHDFGLDPATMGWIFSAFAWSYTLGQLPGGWLVDRFGTKWIYCASIFLWSLLTILQGLVGYLGAGVVVAAMFLLRFLMGLAESPAFPGNSRMVAMWFPSTERGTAAAGFNSGQYFSIVLFAPLSAWLVHVAGWHSVYFVTGGLGILMCFVWARTMYSPLNHPRLSAAELEYISANGAIVDMEGARRSDIVAGEVTPVHTVASKAEQVSQIPGSPSVEKLGTSRVPTHKIGMIRSIKLLMSSRMMVGIYIGQYGISTLSYFFATWFPVYLIQERHMSIMHAGIFVAIPAMCGFAGNMLGGALSDHILRRGKTLTLARKIPIIAGLLLSMTMVICNYVTLPYLVIGIMALSFFGKGVAALGWAVVSDTAPREAGGVSAALFNVFSNAAGITTPLVIGWIVHATGSFTYALIFMAANAALTIFAYLIVVGSITRMRFTSPTNSN